MIHRIIRLHAKTPRKVDQILQMLLLKLQEFNLLTKRLASVKVRTADDFPDVLQREFQFSEEKDLLPSFPLFLS